MCKPLRQLHAEGCAGAEGADHTDLASVELDQLANQGETNSRSFIGSARDPSHTMEALEDARELTLRNADSGVSDLEYHGARVLRVLPDTDRDVSLMSEFERVGHEVEDD